MKNTISYTLTDSELTFECVDSVNDNTDSIVLEIEATTTQTAEIYFASSLIATATISVGSNQILLSSDLFDKNVYIKVVIGDNVVSITFPEIIGENIIIEKVTDYEFSVRYAVLSDNILLRVYPIGSIYMSVESVNPGEKFGGTWESWGSGRVPVGVDASDADFADVQKVGGSKSHTLSANEIPKHRHSFTPSGQIERTTALKGRIWNMVVQSVSVGMAGSGVFSGSKKESAPYRSATGFTTEINDAVDMDANHSHDFTGTAGNTGYVGSGSAHNNLQPYITCYMWRRVA